MRLSCSMDGTDEKKRKENVATNKALITIKKKLKRQQQSFCVLHMGVCTIIIFEL